MSYRHGLSGVRTVDLRSSGESGNVRRADDVDLYDADAIVMHEWPELPPAGCKSCDDGIPVRLDCPKPMPDRSAEWKGIRRVPCWGWAEGPRQARPVGAPSKPVWQLSADGRRVVREWSSVAEAATALGLHRPSLYSAIAQGLRAGGCYWNYEPKPIGGGRRQSGATRKQPVAWRGHTFDSIESFASFLVLPRRRVEYLIRKGNIEGEPVIRLARRKSA